MNQMSDSSLTSRRESSGLEHALVIDQVTKRFSATAPVVLDGIDLTVQRGEFVSLLGASGCGKSTLLNLIAGLEKPSSGEIVCNEQPTLMFQESALFPWLTAGKNIALALELAGTPRAERKARAQQLLELVHLPKVYDLRPHELSGGMRQRVAIARAIAQNRKLLLMDEPFAALDAITRDFLHDELTRIWHETSLAVVFVTHNVREAVRLGQRVILMSSRPGRLIREWKIDIPEPKQLDSAPVAALAREITAELRKEIRRHAA